MYEELYGYNHYLVAKCKRKISDVHFANEEYGKAVTLLNKAVKIYRKNNLKY